MIRKYEPRDLQSCAAVFCSAFSEEPWNENWTQSLAETRISELTGTHKPEKAYFDYCFARIPGFCREKTLMIGDSLSSDILGGKNAGVDTLWLNRWGKIPTQAQKPTYEITELRQLRDIL